MNQILRGGLVEDYEELDVMEKTNKTNKGNFEECFSIIAETHFRK